MALIATMEEVRQIGGVPAPQRVFRSLDNGVTWIELMAIEDFDSLWTSQLLGYKGAVFTGNLGPISGAEATLIDGDLGQYSVIARSLTLGDTWQSVVSPETFPYARSNFTHPTLGSNWDMSTFAILGDDLLLAGGNWSNDQLTTIGSFMRSTDGGATWSTVGPVYPFGAGNSDVLALIGLSNGVALAGINHATLEGVVLRSTDNGDSWSNANVPAPGGTIYEVYAFADLGSGRVVAGGRNFVSPEHRPVTWISTDYGASWGAANTTPVSGLTYPTGDRQHQITTMLPVGTLGGRVVAGVEGNAFTTPSFKPFRLSSDNGVSFNTIGQYRGTVAPAYMRPVQFALADDGSVVATVAVGENFTAITQGEIWRGVLNPAETDITWTRVFDISFKYGGCGMQGVANTEVGLAMSPDALPCDALEGRTRVGTCVDTLTDDDIIEGRGRWLAGDRLIINRVIFSIDYDHVTGQFTKHIVYNFDASIAKFGLRPAMLIESRGMRTTPTVCGTSADSGGGITVGCGIVQLDERAYNIAARFADPPPTLELEVFYRKHLWEAGDLICVTSAYVPNLVTGVRGLDDEVFEIINIRQEFAPEGKLILTLLDVEAITLPAPPTRLIVGTVFTETIAMSASTGFTLQVGGQSFNETVTMALNAAVAMAGDVPEPPLAPASGSPSPSGSTIDPRFVSPAVAPRTP